MKSRLRSRQVFRAQIGNREFGREFAESPGHILSNGMVELAKHLFLAELSLGALKRRQESAAAEGTSWLARAIDRGLKQSSHMVISHDTCIHVIVHGLKGVVKVKSGRGNRSES